MLQQAFAGRKDHLLSSAVGKRFTFKHFSFEVLCMYNPRKVLRNARFLSAEQEVGPQVLVFDLTVQQLEDDWYAGSTTPAASMFTTVFFRGEDWWVITKKNATNADVVILQGVQLLYDFKSPHQLMCVWSTGLT